MSDASLRILVIGADVRLCDRLREIFAQIQGRTLTLEWVGSLHEAIGALSRQQYEHQLEMLMAVIKCPSREPRLGSRDGQDN